MTELEKRYMHGGCHALAYILSQTLNKPIGLMMARHASGATVPDPIHAFVLLDSEPDPLILDIKGARRLSSMQADFQGLLNLIKHNPDDHISLHMETVGDADDLYDCYGFDPLAVPKAGSDMKHIWPGLIFEGKPDLDTIEFTREYGQRWLSTHSHDDSPGFC